MNPATIRMVIATLEDIPDLMDMIRQFYEEDHRDFQEELIKKALVEIVKMDSMGTVYLINCEKQNAGYFILTYSWSLEYGGQNVFIDELYVKRNFRKLGLGKKSIEFIEELAKDKKIKAIHLEVNKYNIARKLYDSKGYFPHNSDLMSKII